MRLFTAILLPDEVRKHLHSAAEAFVYGAIEHEIKLTPVQNLHVTLKFLGEVADARLPELLDRLGAVQVEPAALACDGFVCLPPHGMIRNVAAGLTGDVAKVERLFHAIEDAVEPLGFPREARPFTAHVTLGRNKPGRYAKVARMLERGPQRAHWPGPPFSIDSFALVSSDLSEKAPVYVPVATFPPRPKSEQIS